jgi:DNA processing protein
MSPLQACPDCLRRSWLLSLLGPYLERATSTSAGRNSVGLLRLADEELAAAVAPEARNKLLAEVRSHDEEWFAEELGAADCWAVCVHHDGYPVGLRGVDGGPRALIGRGDPAPILGLRPESAATIVGSRRATSYGRETARSLGRDLASAGTIVVSGLAFGIDACAHRGALEVGGTTIAVLSCGPDTSYPAAHRSLWRRIGETGAVVSELPPGSTPWRWSFPARSRVMAALAGMTVVVEAAARSGSLVTADFALEFGRDLGAVPGPVTSRASAGPNSLLAEGAGVIRSARDVLDSAAVSGPRRQPGGRRNPTPPSHRGAPPTVIEARPHGSTAHRR